ncbi:MAG: hypothetical protein WC440_02035 [Candidatus Omnitrophota bacterium]
MIFAQYGIIHNLSPKLYILMSRVTRIHTVEQFQEVTKGPGYNVIIFIEEGDWACSTFLSRVAEYSREYGFAKFTIVDIKECGLTHVGTMPFAFVPTTAFYRNGKMQGIVSGTDYLQVDARLTSMRHDGDAIAPIAQTLAPSTLRGVGDGVSFRVQTAPNHAIFVTRKPVPAPTPICVQPRGGRPVGPKKM